MWCDGMYNNRNVTFLLGFFLFGIKNEIMFTMVNRPNNFAEISYHRFYYHFALHCHYHRLIRTIKITALN